MARRSAPQGAQHPKANANLPNQISDAGPVNTLIADTENSTHVSSEESGSAALMTGAATDHNKRQVDRALSETDQGVDNISGDIQMMAESENRPQASLEAVGSEGAALASLTKSMEQFVAENDASYLTNQMEIVQEVQTRGLGRSQGANTTDDASASPSLSPGPSTIPAKRPQKKQTSLQTAKKAKNDIWTAENVLQNPKSPLIHVDLKALLANPEAWNVLDQETKVQLLAMLPEDQRMIVEVDGERRINEDFLMYNPDWRHYLGRAQEDISEGRNDPDWLEQAAAASKCRTNGEYDDWKDAEYELFWGTKQKLASNVLTGLASYLKFEDLIKNDLIKPGDVFLLQRSIRGILIEKEIKYIGVRESGNGRHYTCTFPPGVHKFSREDEDITKDDLIGPESISKAAIIADGRAGDKIPNGNAWKSIRVLRNNQDLGTLWDIRQALHFSIREGDYISCVLGFVSHSRRLDKDQAAYVMGYKWLNPYNFLVRLIPVSDIPMQNDILPMHPGLAAEIEKMSLPYGYTVVKCDPRVLVTDGIPLPSSVQVDHFITFGPQSFPTKFTRYVAMGWMQEGRDWSQGHAHVGVLAMNGVPLTRGNGRRVDTKKAKNDRDAEYKKSLPTLAPGKPDLTCVTLAPAHVEHLVTVLNRNVSWRMTDPADLAALFPCDPIPASAVAAPVPSGVWDSPSGGLVSGADTGAPSDGSAPFPVFPGQAASAFPPASSALRALLPAPGPFSFPAENPGAEIDHYSASPPRRRGCGPAAPAPSFPGTLPLPLPLPLPLQHPAGFVPAIPRFQEVFPDLCRGDPAPNPDGSGWERGDFEGLWVDADGFDFRMVDPLFLPLPEFE